MFDRPANGPHTILVVEDETVTRMAVAEFLHRCGLRVLEAGEAAEAMRIFDTGHRVDLVFSDVQMPGNVDGFALARWVRANHPATKVILTSGLARAARDLCDADTYWVAKPYEHAELYRQVSVAIGGGHRAS